MGLLRDTQVEIQDALDLVTGVTAFVDAPSALAPGVAFSRFIDMQNDGLPAGTFLVQWEIVVIAGGTPLAALSMIDDLMGDLINAVQPVVHVRSIGLAEISTGGSPLFGITMNCVRE